MENLGIIVPKLNGGGAERCASNLSLELSKKYNVYVIVFDGRNITYPYGGVLIDLKIAESSSMIKKLINVFKRAVCVRKIKHNFNLKCVISLLDGPNIVNILSGGKSKRIVSIRNQLSSEKMSFLRKRMIVYCSKKADLTVCLSKTVEKDMNCHFGIPQNKLTTIYNHCDPSLLRTLLQEKNKPSFIKDDKVYFTTIGRLNVQKGQWHLIRAFKKVVDCIPEAVLVIMGEGELFNDLNDLVSRLSLQNSVIFTGYVKNPHFMLEYSEMFLFTSLYEGLGNVLLEALAFNVPIISTDCKAGPREILAPNTDISHQTSEIETAEYGVLVPVMDYGHFDATSELTYEEECLSRAIIMLHKNVILRNSFVIKSRRRIMDFGVDQIVREWEQCIEGDPKFNSTILE